MLTDAQLVNKNVTNPRYVVHICSQNDNAPRQTLTGDWATMKEAREFGTEYAMRILNLGVRQFFVVAEKVGK